MSSLLEQMSNWSASSFALMAPAGSIAAQERYLILFAILTMLVVVIPVFILTIVIAIRYREGNTKAKYTPYWSHSRLAESIWWGIPIIVVIILGTVAWKSTHELNPYKPLDSNIPHQRVQVISLNWKWLFIYPDEDIATINYLKIPADTPIAFQIVSDAPMNSFWVPRLSGQIYAMPGMVTQLHFDAEEGEYTGLSANFTGRGFSGMDFPVVAVPRKQFHDWVAEVKKRGSELNRATYAELAEPSVDDPVQYFDLTDPMLFSHVVMKYMDPSDVHLTNPGSFLPGGVRSARGGAIFPGVSSVPEHE